MLRRFVKVTSQSLVLNRVQEQLEQLLNHVLALPIVRGRFLVVDLASGSNQVDHAMGRAPQFVLAMPHANVTVYDERGTNPHTDRFVYVNASGAATVTLFLA